MKRLRCEEVGMTKRNEKKKEEHYYEIRYSYIELTENFNLNRDRT